MGKNLEENGHGLVKVLAPYLPGYTEEIHEESQSG
jgi:hypothetical protein